MTKQAAPYRLLDAGDEKKMESIGDYFMNRQAAQAYWPARRSAKEWDRCQAVHVRTKSGGGYWKFQEKPNEDMVAAWGDSLFKIKLTDFGHIGMFPEQFENWDWIRRHSADRNVLNLFAYTGGSTLAAAQGGGSVTHVDASKGVVSWARENAELNGLGERPIRWIVDDVVKFAQREERRNSFYQGIILDPPTYGRGPKGSIWKIETDLIPFLHQLKAITDEPGFVLLSCHTPGFGPATLKTILHLTFGFPLSEIGAGEMVVPIQGSELVLPSGTYARWPAV